MAHSKRVSADPAPSIDWSKADEIITPDFAKGRRAGDDATTAREKLRSMEDLTALSDRCHASGKKVVLAHGVFDLFHLGHVRHLESAAREGDVLVVSVTADRFVNKGPGRPVFSARLRGEMLAALECVGAVGISEAPGADEMIRAVRPDVYVKGPDYKDQDGDITGKINAERAAVEQYGGRISFTDDMVLSSSQLINDHFSLLDPEVQSYLNGLRVGGALPRVMKAIESVADMKVLFVGDAIIDEYQYAHAMGKSAKENIIASRSVGSEIFAGGIVAAANHAADFCAEVEIITGLGRQDSYEQLIRDSLRDNVKANFVYRNGMPTTRKCRFIDPAHLRKLFEIYYFDDRPLGGSLEQQFCNLIREKAPDFDVVVVADFGHGLITRKSIDALTETANFLAVNAQSNSANLGYNMITKYAKADYVCIDAPEARMASGDRFGELGDIVKHRLSRSVKSDRFVVTDGERGCVAFSSERGWSRIPAFTQQVVDTVGAGDAFLSITAPIAANGIDMDFVGLIGNAVGAMKVGTVGHRQSVEKIPLMKYITALLR
jgi:rfaE bifunctional protein nucleotidyltransferase chain/domain